MRQPQRTDGPIEAFTETDQHNRTIVVVRDTERKFEIAERAQKQQEKQIDRMIQKIKNR